MRRLLWFGLLALFGWSVVWTSGHADEAVGGRHHVQKESLYLWSGGQVQRAFPGLQMLMADVYWLRTVQYYGWEHRYAPDPHYELLEPLIDITVTMDPRLELAYWYGAIFLCETAPQGAGKVDAGVALLERGCRNNPKSWKLRQELAFTRFLFKHDTDGAVDALQEAMRIPGAPVWLRNLVGHFLGAGGARDRARALWQDMYRNESGSMKENARVHLMFLDVLDQRDEVRAAVEEFTKARGRRPESLQEVMSAGFLRRPPVDSMGVPFAYDPATGRVTVSKESRLYRAEDQ